MFLSCWYQNGNCMKALHLTCKLGVLIIVPTADLMILYSVWNVSRVLYSLFSTSYNLFACIIFIFPYGPCASRHANTKSISATRVAATSHDTTSSPDPQFFSPWVLNFLLLPPLELQPSKYSILISVPTIVQTPPSREDGKLVLLFFSFKSSCWGYCKDY